MIRFANEKELFEFIDDRMRETQTTRQERAHYANRMRARYNGIQWLQRSSGMVNAVSNYFGQGTETLYKLTNTTFSSTIASTPKAGALCVVPVSNRLAATRFNGTTGGPDGSAASSSLSHV